MSTKMKERSTEPSGYKKTEDYIDVDQLGVRTSNISVEEPQDEGKLNGAFIASLAVGAIIIVMWVAVYVLYQVS